MIKQAIPVVLLATSQAYGGNIVLIPGDGYLGEIKTHEICDFRYGPGTEFVPGTRLTVSPYTEYYPAGSVIHRGDGMICSTCKVPEIEMGADGVTTIYCEVGPK